MQQVYNQDTLSNSFILSPGDPRRRWEACISRKLGWTPDPCHLLISEPVVMVMIARSMRIGWQSAATLGISPVSPALPCLTSVECGGMSGEHISMAIKLSDPLGEIQRSVSHYLSSPQHSRPFLYQHHHSRWALEPAPPRYPTEHSWDSLRREIRDDTLSLHTSILIYSQWGHTLYHCLIILGLSRPFCTYLGDNIWDSFNVSVDSHGCQWYKKKSIGAAIDFSG